MDQKSTSPLDLAATALVTVAFLAFLVTVAVAPGVLARPAAGSVSWGIIAGLGMIALVIGLSLTWTVDRNRRDRAAAANENEAGR